MTKMKYLFNKKNVSKSHFVRTTRFWNNIHQVHSKSKGWKTK